ncbi:hypothetical protein GCM10011584_24850 [Nocardioides phosphati]|uniref:Glycosyl hydrolase family protein n=1 Tax=Nocardioides phosphati TaxID=1867775 RepID=A0ABQ2NBN3_9ACTN|nr:hypothetical protein [Nocardioides phosphati]GGO91239.1 hypothetical protein GCM10011584_24850 [Nocardioides phosphati]
MTRLRTAVATAVAVAAAALVGPHVVPVGEAAAATAASKTWDWGPIAEVGDWEQGQSTAGWQTWADGTGRVDIYYGQLAVDSGPAAFNQTATGDVVTTKTGAGHVRGRWELRVKAQQWAAARAYPMRLELVPAGTGPTACGATTVTLAKWTGFGSTTRFGIRQGASRWLSSVSLNNNNTFHLFGFELTDTTMTWFVDGQPRARLTAAEAPEAFPTAGLVPRMVLNGASGTAMTHTRLAADWIRYFTLDRAGRTVPATAPPTRSDAVSGVC